jgi:hypothetical protein
MSDQGRTGPDEDRKDIPAGTSGAAARGTQAGGGEPPSELPEADEERAERAERASRETAHTGPHDDKAIGGDLDGPTGGDTIGGAAGAPPSDATGTADTAGGTRPAGPNETARPEDSPGAPSEGPAS